MIIKCRLCIEAFAVYFSKSRLDNFVISPKQLFYMSIQGDKFLKRHILQPLGLAAYPNFLSLFHKYQKVVAGWAGYLADAITVS